MCADAKAGGAHGEDGCEERQADFRGHVGCKLGGGQVRKIVLYKCVCNT